MSVAVSSSDSRTSLAPCTTSSSTEACARTAAGAPKPVALEAAPRSVGLLAALTEQPDRRSRWTARLPAARMSGPTLDARVPRAGMSFDIVSAQRWDFSLQVAAAERPISHALATDGGEVVLEFRRRRNLALLSALTRHRPHDMIHGDLAAFVGREERCRERHVADLATGELELTGKEREVDIASRGRRGWDQQPPEPFALVLVRLGELDVEVDATAECLVEVLREIGREDHHAVVALHPLEEIGDLDVRVAVVRVSHLRALPEQRVGLVEEQDRVASLGGAKDALEVLLGLTDVLADDGGQVDAKQVQAQVVGHDRGGQGLPRPGRTGEQRSQGGGTARRSKEGPLSKHLVAAPDRAGELLQAAQRWRGKHQVGPRVDQRDTVGKLVQCRRALAARARTQRHEIRVAFGEHA